LQKFLAIKMADAQRKKIYNMVLELNNDSLWNPNEQPNANTMYHLDQYGCITYQKGGWAYLQRSYFETAPSISKDLKMDGEKFNHTLEFYSYGRIVSIKYAIVTLQNAMLIRKEMEKLAELL